MNNNNLSSSVSCTAINALAFSGLLALSSISTAAAESTPIVVTATRTAQIADQTVTPTIVITEKDIALSQSRDVAELLRFHAGFELSRNGGPGQSTSVFVRGTESDHVIIMIDGVKMNARTVSTAAIQNMNPDLIERIEIVKGPRSSLYGSEGIGGVINIITKKSTQAEDIIQVGAGVGSDRTRQGRIAYHTLIKNTRIGVDAKHFNTDGFPTVTTSTIDRGFKNNTLNAYVDTKAGATDIGLSVWTAQGTTEYMSYNFATDAWDIPVDQNFNNIVGAFSVNSQIGTNGTIKLKLSHMIDDITQNQSNDEAKTTRQAIDFQSDFDINNNLITAGLYYADEEVDYISFDAPLPDEGKNNVVSAVFVQDDFQYAAHHIVAAIRYTDDKNFGDKTTYNIDYGYALTSKIRLLAGIGTGYRAPSHLDRYGFGGNTDLLAESSQNIELGTRVKIDEHQSLSASLFHNEIDNLIEWDQQSSMLQNIGRTRIKGIEVGYQLRMQNWTSRVDMVFQDPRNLTTNELLVRRAKRTLTGGVKYQSGKSIFGADLLATSERKDFGTTLSAYGIVNLNYQHQLNSSWQIKAHIENLFDKEYQLAANFNTQDRFIMFEVVYNK
ncbi:TonB-dependent receptor domain-containing protein [Kaarinaea lacus]